jgi:predicted RNase H-like HicB family nuclease
MILEYRDKAIEKAEYKKLEDGTWFAEIPGFQGVWANSSTVEGCRKELITVLEEWLILKLKDQRKTLPSCRYGFLEDKRPGQEMSPNSTPARN